MGFFSAIGRSAGRIANVDAIKAGGELIGTLSKEAFAPKCPMCRSGHLHPQTAQVEGTVQQMQACDQCNYVQPASGASDEEFRLLRQNLERKLTQMPDAELKRIMRVDELCFRVYLCFAVATLVYGLYSLVLGGPPVVLLAASGFGVLFTSLAIKSSYRHWQLRTHTFFQPGSLRRWWQAGDWFI